MPVGLHSPELERDLGFSGPPKKELCLAYNDRLAVNDVRRISVGLTRLYATVGSDRDCAPPNFDMPAGNDNPFGLAGDVGKLAMYLNLQVAPLARMEGGVGERHQRQSAM